MVNSPQGGFPAPFDLKQTGKPHEPSSMEDSLHLSPQQWQEDVDFLAS